MANVQIIKLKALKENVEKTIENPMYNNFDPKNVFDLFWRYNRINKNLRKSNPQLFDDLPVRAIPKPSKTTDFDGRGFIKRKDLELLLTDINYCLKILEEYKEEFKITEKELPDKKTIFVVHGRNTKIKDSMFAFLKEIGLKPLEWDKGVTLTGEGTPYTGNVIEKMLNKAQAIVVLLTPDDEARLKEEFQGENEPEYETILTGQARPNVIFEAGMGFGRKPNKTILIEFGNLRKISDITGRHTVRLDNSKKMRERLIKRIRDAGCDFDHLTTNWDKVGDFEIKGR